MEDENIKIPYNWQDFEYEYFEKSAEWFWSIIVLSLAVSAASFILDNFLFGILAGISGVSLALFGVKKPRFLDFGITVRGVQVGDKIFPYSELESFWLHYDPPFIKSLSLKSKKTFMPHIQIPLGDADPNAIREILLKFIKEKEHKTLLADSLIKKFRY